MDLVRSIGCFFFVLVLGAGVSAEDAFEQPPAFSASEILPALGTGMHR
jgi:hypothetical protein